MRFLASALNGLMLNNGVMLQNGMQLQNGVSLQKGVAVSTKGWNEYFCPDQFSEHALGDNWIDLALLGPSGVGDLSNIPGIDDNILDNHFITEDLKMMLCQEDDATSTDHGTTFREYFSELVELAWPHNAKFRLCCSELAGSNATLACLAPDYIFPQGDNDFEPLVLAPHFLTEKFESGQQEALTAALIAKLNVRGIHLVMDLTGHFDLGLGGTRFIAGKNPNFGNYLGNAWCNMFLDCFGDDADHVLCQALTEGDRMLGRNPQFYNLPMFTCMGQSDYPTFESGKACFGKDMAMNMQDGCGFVAAVGPCDEVCVGGFCGVNKPPLEGHGSTNVIYIYMSDYPNNKDKTLGLKIALPILAFILVSIIVYMMWKRENATKTVAQAQGNDAGMEKENDVETDVDE